MTKKKNKAPIHSENAAEFLSDLQSLLQKYEMDYPGKEITISSSDFSLKQTENFVCLPPCVTRYKVIKLPGNQTVLQPYCDCNG